MAGDAPRRSTRASTSKRTYAESDGEEQQHSGKAAPLKTSSSSSKAKAAPKSRKPASKKVKKSADTIESEDDEDPVETASAAPISSDAANSAGQDPVEVGSAKAVTDGHKAEGEEPKVGNDTPEETSAAITITVGSKVPSDIKIADQEGNEVEVGSLTSEKPVVIFLVPKANTPGCTTQACNFRDSYKEFTDLGYDVYSLSQDAPKALTSWKKGKELPYRLLSDPQQNLIRPLGGAKTAKSVQRSHYVIAKGGELLLSSAASPKDSAQLCLAFIKAL